MSAWNPYSIGNRTLCDKIAPKYKHGNHKRFHTFVKDRRNMESRSVIPRMQRTRFRPGFSTSTEYLWSKFGRFRLLSGHLTMPFLSYILHRAFGKSLCSFYYHGGYVDNGERCSAVDWGTGLQAGKTRFRFPMGSLSVFIYLILPAPLWPWVWLSL